MKKMVKIKYFFFSLLLLGGGLLLSGCSLADFWDNKAPETLTRNDLVAVLNNVINWLIGAAAGCAILFLIVGAYQYITSLGNEEQVKKAKTTLTWAIIGLILVLGAYAIVRFIYWSLLGSANLPKVMP